MTLVALDLIFPRPRPIAETPETLHGVQTSCISVFKVTHGNGRHFHLSDRKGIKLNVRK